MTERGAELRQNAIVRTSLVRPVTMMMVLLSAIVIGMVALVNIPLELIPSGLSPPFMQVQVPYGNATAQDVEEQITRPLEQELASTPGLDEISATSRADQSSISLVFEGDYDMDIAYREVRDRVARVRPELPDDVQQIQIRKQSGAALPVAFYGISWDPSVEQPQDKIQKTLVRAVERIDGVGVVNLWGESDREIQIEINRALAEAANLNIFQIAQDLSRANFNLASGYIRDPEGKFTVRSLATYQTVEELENTIVGPNNLRLRDIATITYERPERDRVDRYNGRPTMVMFILKESQANTVEVCDRIRAAIDEVAASPQMTGFQVKAIFLQGDMIRFSLDQVMDSGLQGGVLAFFVLLTFLRRIRLTLIIAASIPLSIFLSLPVMYFLGQSINIISLLGLMICIGLVVDNSVVVAENIERYRERGLGRYAAALHGASEVALPVTLATLTTMVVFAPAALLSSGMTQFFMIRMVTPVCVSLLASLFVALVLVPISSAMQLRRPTQLRRDRAGWVRWLLALDDWWKAKLTWLYERSMGRLNAYYGRLIRLSLRRRFDVVFVAMLAFAATIAVPMQRVPFIQGDDSGGRNFWVYYSMPGETSLEEADEFFQGLEQQLEPLRAQYNMTGQYIGFDATFGQVQFFFDPPKPGERPLKEVRKEIFDLLPERPGWTKSARFGTSDGGLDETFVVSLYGDDHSQVQRAKDDLLALLSQQPGVIGEQNRGADTRRRDELALSVDRTMSERFGVSAGLIANTIAYAIRGQMLPRYQSEDEDREINVRIRYRKQDREQLAQLREFKVPTQAGAVVPIRTMTETVVQQGEVALVRNNKRVASLLRLELEKEERGETVARLKKIVASYQLPSGVSFDADHEAREVEDTQRDLMGAALLSTVFIFLLMGYLFESVVLPLSVLPSIPLSFIGVWWFLWMTKSTMDPLAGIGVLLLLGVVVNNGIVLVDFINGARAQGLSRDEAIIQSGKQRFRPIMMTAMTTIGGMLPLAFSEPTGQGIAYGPFGKALVGGMITATILTLVVVPVAYSYFDDLRVAFMRWSAQITGRRFTPPPPGRDALIDDAEPPPEAARLRGSEDELEAFVGGRHPARWRGIWSAWLRTGVAPFSFAALVGSLVWLAYHKLGRELAWMTILVVAPTLAAVARHAYPEVTPSWFAHLWIIATLAIVVAGFSGTRWLCERAARELLAARAREPDRARRLELLRRRGGVSVAGLIGALVIVIGLGVGLASLLGVPAMTRDGATGGEAGDAAPTDAGPKG
ncbi:MAG: efflux RND transporter permease subunit [Myxococcales bacterium]|nr:efflux RND transporter permease subunit [Myxococcales bacterium]MCB9751407.1 efflux RND transporter permease subunit [Myxococcales bacterium]